MIPTIKLDDRKFDDIRDEAVRLIPRYCPEWTNRNISDPGMTLLSLFSWMTEQTLSRVNQIPTKTYIALLDMLGFSFNPPRCSKSIVNFILNRNRSRDVIVKAGCKIGSVDNSGEPVIFETDSNLIVRDVSLVACVNRDKEMWTEISSENGHFDNFLLFDSQNSVSHELYLSSPALENLIKGHKIKVSFVLPREVTSVKEEIVNYVSWEYYDGEKWEKVVPVRQIAGDKKTDNSIYFIGPLPIMPCEINGKERLCLKATLLDLPDFDSATLMDPFKIKSIDMRVIYTGEGFAPDFMQSYTYGGYNGISTDNDFKLFSDKPAYDEALYICSEDIFRNPGVKVSINFVMSDTEKQASPNVLAQFPLEYFNGGKWVRMTKEANGYVDNTNSFTKSGSVDFVVPDDLMLFPTTGHGPRHLVRFRVIAENLGQGGKYEFDKESNAWKWVFDADVQSPLFNRVRIGYELFDQKFEGVTTWSNFKWNEITYLCEVHESSKETKIFDIDFEHLPSLYLGFDKPISQGSFPIYFRVDEIVGESNGGHVLDFMFNASLEEQFRVIIEWQYWDGNEWKTMKSTDGTKSFQESGFVSFTSLGDMQESTLFEKSCYWIRGVKVNGNFERVPTVKDIVLNAVGVANQDTYVDETLDNFSSASGSYTPKHTKILPGIDIAVCEDGIPSRSELEAMAKDGVQEPYFTGEDGKIWIRYKEVPNLYNSNSFSRHFVVDYQSGNIIFGDGSNGISPKKNGYKVKILKYSVGGGKVGNVSAHKLRYLAASIPFIDGCDNPFPAEGGCDIEDLDSLRARASGLLKSLDRAVTPEDYEWLAKESTPAVGRAMCMRESNKFGEAKVLIIPTSDRSVGCRYKLLPSRELIKQVRAFLDERKVIGTSVFVDGPVYRSFSLRIDLVFKSNYFDYEAEEKKIDDELHEFFHSLYGNGGGGWPIATGVSYGVVLKKLESIESILRVMKVEIYDVDKDVITEEVTIKEDEMPFLTEVKISEKQY